MPLIPLSIVKDDRLLNSRWRRRTPQAFAAQEMCIECLYPVDEATASSRCIDERWLILEIGLPDIEGAAAAT